MVVGGWVGLAVNPHLLEDLTRHRQVLLVSGTNGKTTTAAMLRQAWGPDVAGNHTGANMPQGHVAALVESESPRVVLEVDEAYLGEAVARTSPRGIVLLNLSRDQLDRAAEVRLLAERWRHDLAGRRGVTANANDPLVVFAAETSFDVQWVQVPTPWTKDAFACAHCTRPLHFVDDGDWWCECGFRRPQHCRARIDDDGMWVGDELVDLSLRLPGQMNRSNALMALCALQGVGVEAHEGARRLEELTSVEGRYRVYDWRGRRIRLVLAKNPAGFGEALRSVSHEESVWISINARLADGRDPSWLYDIDVTSLSGRSVMCSGDRCLDLATRLTYAGVGADVVEDPSHLSHGEGDVCVVANYTAFREWRHRLETS